MRFSLLVIMKVFTGLAGKQLKLIVFYCCYDGCEGLCLADTTQLAYSNLSVCILSFSEVLCSNVKIMELKLASKSGVLQGFSQ